MTPGHAVGCNYGDPDTFISLRRGIACRRHVECGYSKNDGVDDEKEAPHEVNGECGRKSGGGLSRGCFCGGDFRTDDGDHATQNGCEYHEECRGRNRGNAEKKFEVRSGHLVGAIEDLAKRHRAGRRPWNGAGVCDFVHLTSPSAGDGI